MGDEIGVGSICSGYAGLDLGIAAAIPNTRLVWVAEYEPPTPKVSKPVQGAARILAHRFPDVPNLGDITVVPWDTTPRAKIIGGGDALSGRLPSRGPQGGARRNPFRDLVKHGRRHHPPPPHTRRVGERVRSPQCRRR
jgi:DNA (cytosine-5)-methyltransferase 1